jgi:hypothetical protein
LVEGATELVKNWASSLTVLRGRLA